MTKTIFVTATATNVGKTYTTLKILELFCAKGVKAVPFKPIETGVETIPLDASTLLDKYHLLYGEDAICLDDICPYRFAMPAAPYVAKNGQDISMETIKSSLQKLKTYADVVVLEGAGGLFVPIERDFFMIDLARELADFTILVSHTGLGCINDALLSKKALQNAQISHELIFNRREGDDFDRISRPFLKEHLDELYEVKDLEAILSK